MKRGRNRTLVNLRDRALAARYYYWTELRRRRFDDVVYILQHHEFFIGSQSIAIIVRQQGDYINELIKQKTKSRELQKLYPAFNFNTLTN